MELRGATRLAVRNVELEGLTDVFQRPHEVDLLKNQRFQSEVIQEVETSIAGDSLDSLAVSPIDHVLMPKGGPFDFRRCALIHPLDSIKYLALVLTMADEIEASRPSVERHAVFSYRFRPQNGFLFNSRFNQVAFQEEVRRRARKPASKVIITCDVADFYDRLNLHRLESILLSLTSNKSRVRQINQLLLFWAHRDSYGLPGGSNASRILAESALIEVDKYLLSIGAMFCRFVDDYRFFCRSAHQAHQWLTQFIERLWLEGLTINKSKTRIEEAGEFRRRTEDVPDNGLAPARTKMGGAFLRRAMSTDTTKLSEKREGNARSKKRSRILAGYGYGIPTRFREPGPSEMKQLRETGDPRKLLEILVKKSLPEASDVTRFVKTLVSKASYSLFTELPAISESYPQLTPYIVDAIETYAEKLTEPEKRKIGDSFACRLIPGDYIPEYLSTAIVHLLGTSAFQDKERLLHYFRGLQRNAGAYIGRCLLDALEDKVTRGEVIEIRSYYPRADGWEKRAIAQIVCKHLHDDEKRPWIKNIKIQDAKDIFLMEIIRERQRPVGSGRPARERNIVSRTRS